MEGNLLLTFFSLGLSGQQTDLSKVINYIVYERAAQKCRLCVNKWTMRTVFSSNNYSFMNKQSSYRQTFIEIYTVVHELIILLNVEHHSVAILLVKIY